MENELGEENREVARRRVKGVKVAREGKMLPLLIGRAGRVTAEVLSVGLADRQSAKANGGRNRVSWRIVWGGNYGETLTSRT